MKTTNIIRNGIVGGCAALLSLGLVSCEDWLTLYPSTQIVEEEFWQDKNDIISVRNGVYKKLSSGDCVSRFIVWGEGRSDNVNANTNPIDETITRLQSANLQPEDGFNDWSAFYTGINYCNKVLEHGEEIKKKDVSFTDAEWLPMQTEMVTMRALYYFYLIRAFGDVPYVTKAINNDSQVAKVAVTPQKDILDDLIKGIEAVKDNGTIDFGKTSDNKGYITRKAAYTVLADLYLWRAALTKSNPDLAAESDADYKACIENCDYVINEMIREEEEENNNGYRPGSGSGSSDDESKYPLIENKITGSDNNNVSVSFNEIFIEKNSTESIFELQFDDSNNKNSSIETYYRNGNNSNTTGKFIVSDRLINEATSNNAVSQTGGFYKYDLRKLESIYKPGEEDPRFIIAKYSYRSFEQYNYMSNLNNKEEIPGHNFPELAASLPSSSPNWIIYRLSDVLLMKAEALCCSSAPTEEDLTESFKLVEEIYKRSNPHPYTKGYVGILGKLQITEANTAAKMEKLVMTERQREFVGEGKRWFDLVRYALRRGNPKDMVDNILSPKYPSNERTAIKSKLASMNALYLPIYKNELDVNDLLKQNPAWDKDETISKN